MPVSIITSHGRPGAASFHRATCSGVLSTGRALLASAVGKISGPTPCRTHSSAPSGSGPSASASAQVETKKSRQPGLGQQPRHFASAKAIAVGLDRRAGRHAGGALQPAPIILEG